MTYTERQLLKISQKMSYLLRHNPKAAELEISEYGEVDLQSLASAVGVSTKVVREIVENDSKGRYEILGKKIYATQGHSFPVLNRYEEVEFPGILFHGTKQDYVDSIKREGLSPGKRLHVHLSPTLEVATTVASRRSGVSVILKIDGNSLVSEGAVVLRSPNGVYLTSSVPWKYVVEVIRQ